MPGHARLYDFTTGLFRAAAPIKVRPDATAPGPAPTPPATAARFGPNGTYWAPNTPLYDGSDSAHSIEVNCTGAAIKAAIQALTAQQVAAGVRILVRPGTMPSGTNEASPAVGFVGDPTWSKRVLVRPRDTRDSVDFKGYMVGVNSVIWAGFQSTSFRIYGGVNTGWARILWKGASFTAVHTRSDQPAMTGLYLGECVRRETAVTNGDPMDMWTYGVDNVAPLCEGWHLSPNFRETSAGHTDTMQMEPFGATPGYVRNATFRGCALFGSNNTAIQVNGLRGAMFEDCYLVRYGSQTRYPTPEGYNAGLIGGGSSINGSSDAQMSFLNSVIIGGITVSNPNPLGSVVNTTIRQAPAATLALPTSGAFTVDGNLHDDTHPDRPPSPTDAYLNSIWGL